MTHTNIVLLMILLTILLYLPINKLYQRYPIAIFNPTILCTVLIIVILVSFNLPYDTYMEGGEWINNFLSPTVVALAYPLYKQKDVLKKYLLPILSGMLTGILVSVGTGIFFTYLLHISKEMVPSVVSKNVTTPIALKITEQLGGVSALTAVFVMIAGFSGVLLGPTLIKLCRFQTFLGKGMAFGNAAHAIGTAKAFEYDQATGSISSAAMIFSAVFGSILIPLIVG
ncbi:LrgB family protein [Caldibacillus lycopersici]|uniref:LrgB family protein n=1 Tax=Perspicuibacillus lycopersici TaxID=1325689 RepID=A0AAE3IX87_9BACI|nr:LrgB family protein [Perspicuibacillus lycopersici]MCU9615064.1 LrgB family protein [Perspicuibacillus lycopersici]